MDLKEHNVLFFTRTMKLGGTENVILQLCEILRPKVNKIVVCSCGGVNVEKLRAMGITHYQIPDIENKSLSTFRRVISAIKTIVKEEEITIIHTHHRMAAFYVSLLGLYKKCKFLNTSHNTFDNKKALTRFAYKHAQIVACGEMVKKNLIEFFELRNNQVTVIHNAVKPFTEQIVIDPFLKQLRDNGLILVGNVGRLSEQKGMIYYIDAIAELKNQYSNVHYLIIGSGEDENILKKCVHDKKLDNIVTFMGYRSDIQNIISQLDFVVLSSLWEGLPLTPIEAFSVGRTVIATAVDGTPEIVKNKENGLLVQPRNHIEIAEAMALILNNVELRHEMEKKAYRCYIEEFSFDTLAEKYLSFYDSL